MTPATLRSIEQLNDTTYTFWFELDRPLEYTAGQFVEIFLPHNADERGTHRWFTLSSSPSEKQIAITTRKVSRKSTFKEQLFSMKPGDVIQISQAMGDFVLPMQKSIPIIFLVRGIGITPVRSMLTDLRAHAEQREISIVYSAKDSGDFMFTELLEATATQIDTYELLTNSDIELPTQKVINTIKNSPTARVYISGPEQFVEKAYEKLLADGLKQSALVTDYFHGYE